MKKIAESFNRINPIKEREISRHNS